MTDAATAGVPCVCTSISRATRFASSRFVRFAPLRAFVFQTFRVVSRLSRSRRLRV
jgi:hypothetical protein